MIKWKMTKAKGVPKGVPNRHNITGIPYAIDYGDGELDTYFSFNWHYTPDAHITWVIKTINNIDYYGVTIDHIYGPYYFKVKDVV